MACGILSRRFTIPWNKISIEIGTQMRRAARVSRHSTLWLSSKWATARCTSPTQSRTDKEVPPPPHIYITISLYCTEYIDVLKVHFWAFWRLFSAPECARTGELSRPLKISSIFLVPGLWHFLYLPDYITYYQIQGASIAGPSECCCHFLIDSSASGAPKTVGPSFC